MGAADNIERILDKAADVLGSRDRAEAWLDKRSATLKGTPRELAGTDDGARAVLLHLARISRHSLS